MQCRAFSATGRSVLPNSLVLKQWAAFTRAELPLRPITLICGHNDVGKTALLQAVTVLRAAVVPGQGRALHLPSGILRRAQEGPQRCNLGVTWSDDQSVQFGLDGQDDQETLSVSRVRLGRDLDGGGVYEQADTGLRHRDTGKVMHLDGLVPGPLHPDLRARMQNLRGRARSLPGVRAPLPRFIEQPQAQHVLGQLQRNPGLLDQVNTFFARLRPGMALLVNQDDRGTWLEVVYGGMRVHLNDCGGGLTQVLPVLVEAELTAQDGGILAVEHPEHHLHPDAQRILAEHLCALVARSSNARFVLETHSRVTLLAVQLAIAQGTLAAHQVRVVWVCQDQEGTGWATTWEVNPDGSLGDGWPGTAKDEDLRLGVELARAVAARRGA